MKSFSEFVLTERVHDIVYHVKPSISSAYRLLKNGYFRLSNVTSSYYKDKLHKPNYPIYYLSLARSKAAGYLLDKLEIQTSLVNFKLDGSWFNDRYKSIPVDYWGAGYRRDSGKSEQEDRVYSKTPTILIDAISEIHVYIFGVDGENNTYLRKLLIEAKKRNLPIFVYAKPKDFLLQVKSRAMDSESLKIFVTGKEIKAKKNFERTKYLKPWLELWHSKDETNLSSQAKTLLYNIKYYSGDNNLKNDLSNARRPYNYGWEDANKITDIMYKNKLDINGFINSIKTKFKKS